VEVMHRAIILEVTAGGYGVDRVIIMVIITIIHMVIGILETVVIGVTMTRFTLIIMLDAPVMVCALKAAMVSTVVMDVMQATATVLQYSL